MPDESDFITVEAELDTIEKRLGKMLKAVRKPKVEAEAKTREWARKESAAKVAKALELAKSRPTDDHVASARYLRRQHEKAFPETLPEEPAKDASDQKPLLFCAANGVALRADGFCPVCRRVHPGETLRPRHSESAIMKHLTRGHGLR